MEVDGQRVRCRDSARELLRTSSEVVRLQLLRHGLPRHRVEEDEEEKQAMGSNLSRHSGKGLTGRRSQSSGNLCNGKALTPGVGRFFSPCGRGDNDSVGPRDRYKFCGSLPNHLDAKDPAPEDDCSYRNNNNEPLNNKKTDLELRLHPLTKGDQDQGYGSERSPEDVLPLPPPPLHQQLLPESCPLVCPGKPLNGFHYNLFTLAYRSLFFNWLAIYINCSIHILYNRLSFQASIGFDYPIEANAIR